MKNKVTSLWVSVNDRVPEDSHCVLITDGEEIGGAHYFASSYSPRTGEVFGPSWANQHYRLTGGYIDKPTHWMEIIDLLSLLIQE